MILFYVAILVTIIVRMIISSTSFRDKEITIVRLMKKILCHIKSDWNKLANKPELIILKTNAIRTRLCTIIITIAFYLYIIFLTLPSIICILLYNFDATNETVLILPIYLNNFLKDQMNYYFTFLFECVFIIIITTIGITHYSMFVLIVQHACALFNIVASKIENGFKSNFSHPNNRNKFAQEYEWLVDIIEFYDNAIDFVDLMKLYNKIIYPFEVFFSLLFIIINYFYFFQLLSFTINTTEVLQKFNYIIGSMFVIYVYCYLGQKLIDYHNEIFMKLCQIPFYSFSLKTQKMLPFMIMKSLMPCNLSIKGVIVLSNLHFVTLMRISFSYAMIVYNSL
ncbi:odorant receptor 47a-like isoform X1 [Vespa velutina]|uniref:odorant receptor 47a-like isoform X1 n=1 Tax=Vespa velutina TaxID=202808 RepID=UPI001FB36075|nr:odorant receptor 47a-like isoform X1 [Vespa velutina]